MKAIEETIMAALLAIILVGCASDGARKLSGAGMYANSKTGFVAIGKVSVVRVTDGEESVSIDYEEDTAWLSPSTKTHKIGILITGPNATEQAEAVVSSICEAFVGVNHQAPPATSANVHVK